jgi:hypothetical protein
MPHPKFLTLCRRHALSVRIEAFQELQETAHVSQSRGSQTLGRTLWGAFGPLWGGGGVCMRVIFILDEIWAKDKIHNLAGTLLG